MTDNITIKNGAGSDIVVRASEIGGVYTAHQRVTTAHIPDDFTKTTSSSITHDMNKGQLNELRIRPQILNEQCESSRVAHGVVSSGNHVGQFFKHSQENINGITIAVESAESRTTIDNFNVATYIDDAAIQAVWAASDDLAVVDPIFYSGNLASDQSMELSGEDTDATWTKTISSTDLTGVTIEFDFAQSKEFKDLKYSFVIGDGSNTNSIEIAMNSFVAQYIHFGIPITAMSADGGTPADVTAITKITVKCIKRKGGETGWIDNLRYAPEPGSLDVLLYDMGSTLPVSTSDALDDGTQYTQLGDIGAGDVAKSKITLSLIGGKRRYHIRNFIAGVSEEIPSNVQLTVNNYYAIVLKYVDTDVTVYGNDVSLAKPFYTNGFAFTCPDDATPVTATGTNEDIMFKIYSTQDVYLTTFRQFLNAEPGDDAEATVYIEDSDMSIAEELTNGVRPIQDIIVQFSIRTFFLPKGGKFEVNYNDDSSDNVTVYSMTIGFAFKPPTVNG